MCSMPLLKFSVVCWQSLVLLGLYQRLPHLHLYLHVASCVCMCVHIPPFLVSTEGPDLWWFNLTFFNFAMVWQWNAFSRNCTLNFVPSKIGVFCFPQSYGSPTVESHWPSRSDSLGIPSPFVRSPGWKPAVGSRTFTTVGELLWYYCSPVCGSPTQQVWDLILSWLCSSYHLAVASSLFLDMGYLFLVCSGILLWMVVW